MENINVQELLPFIVVVLATILVLIAAAGVRKAVRRKINRFRYYISGGPMVTALLKNAVTQTNIAAEETPMMLSNVESLYIPKIKTAYPDLNLEDLRNKAVIALKEYLDSVKKQTATSRLEEIAAKSLCDSVHHLAGKEYTNSPFVLHQVLISNFTTGKIRFSIAYKSDCQRKAAVEFAYLKEVETTDEELEKKCTNCSAILTREAQALGHCLYCDQVFKTVNEYAWLAVKIKIEK